MEAPKLTREVELPRQRSNGAAVVLVAAMAMFTAVAASAFVVRVRMHATHCARSAPVIAAPAADDDRGLIPFEVIGSPVSPVAVNNDLAGLDPFHAAIARGDDEAALQAWLDAPDVGLLREVWRNEREAVARSYLADQFDHIGIELENGDCAAVSERLARLARLLPDRGIPAEMAICTDQGSR